MVFNNSPAGRASARRAKNEQVFCVGWHAFVHWPQRPGESLRPVPLTDGAGVSLAAVCPSGTAKSASTMACQKGASTKPPVIV